MLIQQAVFTSVRSGRNEGYQIAAASPDISPQELRELAQWGPGHNSLYDGLHHTESINFHQMQSGRYCVSRTLLAGREYSGRGGQRVYSHMFLVPDDLFGRFGNSPFRIVESLIVADRLTVYRDIPARLESLELLGRCSLVNTANLEHVVQKIGARKLASLVDAALHAERLGVCCSVSGKRLFSALLDLLPPRHRLQYSLTTGLRISATRLYRLAILPQKTDEHRRAVRALHLELLDLTRDPPTKYACDNGWPELMYELLRKNEYAHIAKVIETVAHSRECDTDLLAEQQRELLEKDRTDLALTSLRA